MPGMSRTLTPAWLVIAVVASFAAGFVLVPIKGSAHDPVTPASAQPVSAGGGDSGGAAIGEVVALGAARALPRLVIPRPTVAPSHPHRRAARVVVTAVQKPAASVTPPPTTPQVNSTTPAVTPTQNVNPTPTPAPTPRPTPTPTSTASKPTPQRNPSPTRSPEPAPASTTFDSTG